MARHPLLLLAEEKNGYVGPRSIAAWRAYIRRNAVTEGEGREAVSVRAKCVDVNGAHQHLEQRQYVSAWS